MKYLYIGSGIIAVILVFCILVGCMLNKRTDETAQALRAALTASEQKNYSDAAKYAKEASEQWNKHLCFFSSFLCHDETDKITETFSELLACTDPQDATDFRVSCSQLLTMLTHISEMDLPLSYNIL